jgi:hypothetical protein
MARTETAGEIINRAAVEVGLTRVADPFSTTNEGFTQMTGLLNAAGLELAQLFQWEALTKEFEFNTTTDVTAGYADLPDDYDRLIQQTGWDLDNDVPIIGPLSAQQWAYVKGRDLAANTIYVSYRINNARIEVYPDPPPADVDVSFRYISRDWATDSAGTTALDYCTQNSDIVLLDPLLMQKFLKAKYLEAKAMPTAGAARLEFDNMLQNRLGSDKGGQILNGGSPIGRYPYLNAFFNTPDTGYGP